MRVSVQTVRKNKYSVVQQGYLWYFEIDVLLLLQPFFHKLYFTLMHSSDFIWFVVQIGRITRVQRILVPVVYTALYKLEGSKQGAFSLLYVRRMGSRIDPRIEGAINECLEHFDISEALQFTVH